MNNLIGYEYVQKYFNQIPPSNCKGEATTSILSVKHNQQKDSSRCFIIKMWDIETPREHKSIKTRVIINDLNEIKIYFTFAATVQFQTNAACCRHR
jgi:hypothetical protein